MSIYQRIKDVASEKNLTVKDIEKALNFSNGSLRKWVNNANSERLIQVANYLDVSTDYLLGRTNIQDKASDRIRKLEKYVPVREYEDEHSYYNERAILINTFDTLVNLLVLNGFEITAISDDFDDVHSFYNSISSRYPGSLKEKFAITFLNLIHVTLDDDKSKSDEILERINNFIKIID
ncbi:helix-turn-helix domain-containing protein [Ligilactobacillus salivarius]|uniref:helix-turn-helix domain-containing protein n=1 Tax=Ligilactobacillus salivarius TaxID=1624 RepID=UPI000B3B99B9|nr:helix-turn-helix transcriptional regulator [Ligilactobacillus salivarius]